MQRLRPEVRERTALEHEVLAADGDLDASFQYEHEIVDGLALLVDDAGRVGLEQFLVFHFYVEYHVLLEQTHQDRFRHHVRLESFDACGGGKRNEIVESARAGLATADALFRQDNMAGTVMLYDAFLC